MMIHFLPLKHAARTLVLSGVLLLQACQKDMNDLEVFVRDAYKDKKPKIEPLPEIQPYQGYEYSASEESDPFSSSNIVSRDGTEGVSGKRPDADRRREALEEFPLDALSFVGTITKQQEPWVIVQTSRGTAHLATIGNYLGQNDGKIKTINAEEQRVVLVETVLDSAGRWVTRNVELIIDE